MSTPFLSEPSIKILPAETILSFLSESQYLHPHQPLEEVLQGAADVAGVCPEAIAMTMQRLQLDSSKRIGRLRSSELVQLSRCIYRNWKQAASHGTSLSSTG